MIPNWLPQRAYITPDKIALSFEEDEWTFAELYEKSRKLARKLTKVGFRKGNRIAILGKSNAEMVFMIHACLLSGIEMVLLNNRLTVSELEWQMNDAEVDGLLVDDHIAKQLVLPMNYYSFSAIQQAAEESFNMEETWDPGQTLTIMYTSGTTGFPKGVRQTAQNHTSSAVSSVLNLGLTDEDAWLCMVPLFHISGFSILARSVIYGMKVRLYEKFDEAAAAAELIGGEVTAMSIVALPLARVIRELEEADAQAHPLFRNMLVGGGPVPVDYLERARARGIPVLQTYGMTETSSQTATLTTADATRKAGSAGKPLFFNQIKIKDALEPFEQGEVCVRGPHVTQGYIGSHAKRSPLTEDGWFETGDIGYLDDEGYLFIVDRRADLIISGGENIYPAEVENALLSHPAVLEAGVVGKEDPVWGSVPVAFVVTSESISTTELLAYCGERLARYKLPKEILVVDELPRNASNKLMRHVLKTWIK